MHIGVIFSDKKKLNKAKLYSSSIKQIFIPIKEITNTFWGGLGFEKLEKSQK
jgi:hypothetical protein